eukprot:11861354-Alexandrium_andersonii.AAC.1
MESATSCIKRLIPRPIRGRWGSLFDTERYLVKCGKTRLACVFPRAMAWRLAAKSNNQGTRVVDLDEQESFTEKLGRWTRDAVNAVHSNAFWKTLLLRHVPGSVLAHLMAFIQKEHGGGVDEKTQFDKPSSLRTIVYTRAAAIAKEFCDLLGDAA